MSCASGVTCGDVIVSVAHDALNLYSYMHSINPTAYATGRSTFLLSNYDSQVTNGSYNGVKEYLAQMQLKLRSYVEDTFSTNPLAFESVVTTSRAQLGCLCTDYVNLVGWDAGRSQSFTLSSLANDIFVDEYMHPLVLWAKQKYGCKSVPRNMAWMPPVAAAQAPPGAGNAKFMIEGPKAVTLAVNAAPADAVVQANQFLNGYRLLDVKGRFVGGGLYGIDAVVADDSHVVALNGEEQGRRNLMGISGEINFEDNLSIVGQAAARNYLFSMEGRFIPNQYGDYYRLMFANINPQPSHYLPTIGLVYDSVPRIGGELLNSWNALLDRLNDTNTFVNNVIPEALTNLTPDTLFGGDFFTVITAGQGIVVNKLNTFKKRVMRWYMQAVALLIIDWVTNPCCS